MDIVRYVRTVRKYQKKTGIVQLNANLRHVRATILAVENQ